MTSFFSCFIWLVCYKHTFHAIAPGLTVSTMQVYRVNVLAMYLLYRPFVHACIYMCLKENTVGHL